MCTSNNIKIILDNLNSDYEKSQKECAKLGLECVREDCEYNRLYRALYRSFSPKSAGIRAEWQKDVIDYMIKKDGSLEAFYQKVISSTAKLRKRTAFQLDPKSRKEYKTHIGKRFKEKTAEKEIKLEDAIKFHLVGKEIKDIGKIVAYELPVIQSDLSGAVDCVAYKDNQLRLIELKRCEVGDQQENHEMFLRAYTEIVTYRACLENHIQDDVACGKLQEDLVNVKITAPIRSMEIINCIIAPKSMYSDVDGKIREFVNNTKDKRLKTEFYSIALKKDIDIDGREIKTKELLFDIEKVEL